MDAISRSDIFFSLTSLAVILMTAGILIVLYYVIKILKDVESITETTKQETDEIAGDIDSARSFIKRAGLLGIFGRLARRLRRRSSHGAHKRSE